MAKVVITIEDKDNGKVSIVSDPSFETMAMMSNSGSELTSAHGYALCMVRAARTEAKAAEPTKILIPKVRL